MCRKQSEHNKNSAPSQSRGESKKSSRDQNINSLKDMIEHVKRNEAINLELQAKLRELEINSRFNFSNESGGRVLLTVPNAVEKQRLRYHLNLIRNLLTEKGVNVESITIKINLVSHANHR